MHGHQDRPVQAPGSAPLTQGSRPEGRRLVGKMIPHKGRPRSRQHKGTDQLTRDQAGHEPQT